MLMVILGVKMTTKTIAVDSYEPDYKSECCICGQSPVVTMVAKDGKTSYSTDMCGPCTWGEARTIDPDTWNE